jgi:hypothetical protein
MKTAFFATLAAALLIPCAFAQNATCNNSTPALCGPGSPAGDTQIKPQAVPTASQVVTTYDAYLKTITITNTTAGALTFTLSDRQPSPVAVLAAVAVAANTTYVIVFPNFYWCPSGFSVVASGAGLNWYGAFRQ